MLSKIRKHKRLTILYLILLTMSIVSMTVLNMRIAYLFQAAQTKDYVLLMDLFLVLFIWYISTRLVDYLSEIASFYLINKIREDIKNELFRNYIHQSMERYSVRDAGRYVSDFTNDITMVESKALLSYKELIKSILTIIAGNVAIFTIDYRMNIIITIGILICLLIPYIFANYTTAPMNNFIQSFEFFVQQLKDYFSSFFAIKNFAAEDFFYQKFKEKNNSVENTKLNAEITIDFVNNLIGRIAWFIEFAVISVGVIEVINGDIEVSILFSAYLITGEICMPLQSISGYINNIKSVAGVMGKNKHLFLTEEIIKEPFDVPGETTVKFEHYSLTKNSRKILNDICLEFQPRKKYLIIGRNGSGKSTLAKSLKNVYSQYDGNIYIEDRELRSIPNEQFDNIAIYSNETVSLFSDSVRNNITLYREVSEESLNRAMSLSHFGNPLDYMIVDKGVNISSGERRKLELARVLLTDTPILIFDEVISTLDIETAYDIEKLILSLDKTVIMISNAFSGSLLSLYDEIILIDNGNIINHGSHEYMLEHCQEYKNLYHVRCEL